MKQPESNSRFSSNVYARLKAAGWRPGRNVGHWVDGWSKALAKQRHLELFDAAREALLEFGGLKFREGFWFNAYLWLDVNPVKPPFSTEELLDYSGCIHERLFPLGSMQNGNSDLYIGESGKVYEIWDIEIWCVGESLDCLFENRWGNPCRK